PIPATPTCLAQAKPDLEADRRRFVTTSPRSTYGSAAAVNGTTCFATLAQRARYNLQPTISIASRSQCNARSTISNPRPSMPLCLQRPAIGFQAMQSKSRTSPLGADFPQWPGQYAPSTRERNV